MAEQKRRSIKHMKKPASKIREDIARLQEDLKAAETREAQRIGRVALKAGLGDIDIDETKLLAVFEELAGRFRESATTRQEVVDVSRTHPSQNTAPAHIDTGAAADGDPET